MTRNLLLSLFIWCALLALNACVPANPWNVNPKFPEGEGRWLVPLLDPLTRSNAFVIAELHGEPDGGKAPVRKVLALVDSGAFSSSIGRSHMRALGVKLHKSNRLTVRDAAGKSRWWRGGAIPSVRFEDLELRDFWFGTHPSGVVLGRNLLDAYPWAIDLDAGVFEIGAASLGGGLVGELPFVRRDGAHHVEVEIGGRSLLLYFDTGASMTSIDGEVLARIGLERQPLARPMSFSTLFGQFQVGELFKGSLHFGLVNSGAMSFAPLPAMKDGGTFNRKVVGLLGYDALARTWFRVVPGESIQFKKRGDVVRTAARRIHRWPWATRCKDHPGCVTAEPTWSDAGLEVELTWHGVHRRQVSTTLACIAEDGTVDFDLPYIEFQAANPVAGEARKLMIPAGMDWSNAWLDRARGHCPRIAVLDINPVIKRVELPSNGVHFTMRLSVRASSALRQ